MYAAFLRKPFKVHTVVEVVNAVIDRDAATREGGYAATFMETGAFGKASFWLFAPSSCIELQNRFARETPRGGTGSTGRDLDRRASSARTALTRFIPPERIGIGEPAPM